MHAAAQEKAFTIEQALSAPFTTELIAAPAKGRLAWEANIDGRRNLWVADPAASGKGYASRQITHYTEDDGQEINTPEWTPDGASIVYVHGSNAQGEGHPVPNPAAFPKGAQQQIWIAGADGGEPRLLAEGNSPAVSPDGKTVAYTLKGQLWSIHLDDPAAKPEQLLQTRGEVETLRWSPDGAHLAFVSDRDDHSFIAVYTVASGAVYVSRSFHRSRRGPSLVSGFQGDRVSARASRQECAALRRPSHRAAMVNSRSRCRHGKGRTKSSAQPKGKAAPTARQIRSTNCIGLPAIGSSFPWELTGWLHLYAVPSSGGAAKKLTSGANFEVEHVSLSADRKTLVFDSNQNDIDRRHVWQVSFSDRGCDRNQRCHFAAKASRRSPW